MTRTRARRGVHDEIVVFHQPHAGLGMADELDACPLQCFPNPRAGMRLVTANWNRSRQLPIGDGVGMKAGSTGKLVLRPAEQAARCLDLAAHDNADDTFRDYGHYVPQPAATATSPV